jgi:NIPSNAP
MSGCDVIELRRYALHPGARHTLIELFERELVEPQEAVGMRVLGTFRDVDDPDSFVWIRGFADMAARGEGLRSFYGGPVWAEHRDAANATMIDSDNVFLLRPVDGESRFDVDAGRRRAPGVASVTICPLGPGRAPAFARHSRRRLSPPCARPRRTSAPAW